jgi:DGQHR domain-containing protein
LADGELVGEVDFLSLDPIEEVPRFVNLRIHARQLEWPPPTKDPQISRVDGNHRLSQVSLPDDETADEYPVIPFSLFVGLSADQERALFRDINGTQKKMETAHLDTIRLKLSGPAELFKTEGGRALWIAQQLAESNRAFEGKVFFGGSKKGAKAASGSVPPIRINTLKSAVATTLRDMTRIEEEFFGGEDEEGQPREITEEDVLQVLALIDRYWKAVAHAYPREWQERSAYILLQAIGLTAFSRLGAEVIKVQFFDENSVRQEDFNNVLEHIASEVDLSREAFPGIAGLAGAKEVYRRLTSALNSQAIAVATVKRQLAEEVAPKASPLDN